MNKQNENGQGEDGSHINNIIDRLREARDGGNVSEERSRDIIERSDGTKVVKIRRRRRVYQDTARDMDPSTTDFKKWILIMGMGVIFICIAAIAFLMVRISSFNTEEFLRNKEQELGQAWNAQVEISGLSFEGLSFSVGKVTARFPETSLIKEATFQNISANLIPVSFITGVCKGDLMKIGGARVILRNNVDKFAFPGYRGKELWNYSRYRVERFEVDYEDPKTAPFRLNSELYVRRSEEGNRFNCNLSSKTLSIKGWEPISLTVASIYVTHEGLEYLDINGTMSDTAVVSIKGEFKQGMSFSQPTLTLSGVNIPLASITKNQFTPLVTAEFGASTESHDASTSFLFSLPGKDHAFPPFSGDSNEIRKIVLKNIPMFKELSDLTGNKAYLTPALQSGKGKVSSDGNGISFSNFEANEFSFLSVSGSFGVSNDKSLSGRLSLGIPRRSAMKGDMIVDPLFIRDDGETVWVDLSLSGTLMKPMDNTIALVRSVQNARDRISREKNLMIDSTNSSSRQANPGGEDESNSSEDEEFKSLLR